MRKFKVTLEQQERDSLVAITQKGNHQSRKVLNALILLNCDQGQFQDRCLRNEDVAAVLKISLRKIDRVKKRFVEEGLDVALHGRKGQRVYEKKADGDFEAHLVALSCSQPPEGFSQWSLRLLADRVVELNYIDSISYETVRRVLKKNEIKPWKKKGWVIPPEQNADFVAAMEKVLDVYKRPYNKDFPVLCMDESPRQLIRETRTAIPAAAGRPECYDYEYERCGRGNIFMVSEPLAGRRMVKVTEHRRKSDWASFIQEIAQRHEEAAKITLVMDNLNTHGPGSLYETFAPEEAKALWDRFEFVYTPKHGSWLNMAEIELNVLAGQCLKERIDNRDELASKVAHWQAHRNNRNSTINWQFTTEKARTKLRRLYPTIEM